MQWSYWEHWANEVPCHVPMAVAPIESFTKALIVMFAFQAFELTATIYICGQRHSNARVLMYQKDVMKE